jgi:pyrroloquinoline quinone biosynthesis protein B
MGRLTAIVLGAAAGGGYPQWNCRCPVCRMAWDGDSRVRRSTQASIAVTVDGRNYILFNASPDLREQIATTPSLQPQTNLQDGRLRGSPIAAVVLTGAEIDQTAGLLVLRERHAFALYGSAETLATVAANPMSNVLAPDLVARRACALGEPFWLADGLSAELFTVPGKVPLYLEGGNPALAAETEANVGVELVCGERRLAFVPGCAAVTPALKARLKRADAVLFDGTLFADDEMIASGTGAKTGRRMGHMPIDGEAGSLAALADVSGRRIYMHINNTNPIRVAGAPERRKVEAAGCEIAEDGFRIEL